MLKRQFIKVINFASYDNGRLTVALQEIENETVNCLKTGKHVTVVERYTEAGHLFSRLEVEHLSEKAAKAEFNERCQTAKEGGRTMSGSIPTAELAWQKRGKL